MLISDVVFGDDKLKDGITKFGYVNVEDVKTVDSCNHGGLTSTLGLEQFVNVEEVHLIECNLTELDLSTLTKLKKLFIDHNNLTILDISNNPDLELIYCFESGLTSIDTSNHPGIAVRGL